MTAVLEPSTALRDCALAAMPLHPAADMPLLHGNREWVDAVKQWMPAFHLDRHAKAGDREEWWFTDEDAATPTRLRVVVTNDATFVAETGRHPWNELVAVLTMWETLGKPSLT